MTDIVERLRAHKVGVRWKRGIDTDYPVEWEPHPLCSEAADEIERLRRDAERYRWLRSADTGPAAVWDLMSDTVNPQYMTLKCGADLDAAVDKAMRETQK